MASKPDQADKWVLRMSDAIVTLPDGTLLDPEPVRRLIRAGQPVSEEDMEALRKTEEKEKE